ncbi:uncharacterized protein LOC102083163 isoform X2 [Oreochromis niloticus]|uniref:uncharacterized protein LOC102083163 isoform X2 n=1 Tax=Oreochromis niloticus TaxID=8128 RepID=UPI000DF3AD59|nr:uncharacterized protein LOC102083163 isoform X2 [Oreochromis niloticus]
MIRGVKRGSVNVTLESSSHHRLVFKPRGFFRTPFSSHQLQGSMLLKAKLGGVQKFVRVSVPSLKEFLIAAFAKFGVPAVTEGVKVFDSSGTELDEDVFEDIVTDPSTGVLTIKYETGLETSVAEVSPERFQLSSPHSSDSQDTVILSDSPLRKRQKLDAEAKQLVESILTSKPGGERIINEYNRTKSLVDETRRKMVNILVADMTEKNGTSPPRQVKEMYARGIVTFFPYLSDPYSKNGYEHYYDGESGTGYLAWRIKTIQRCTAKERRLSSGGDGSSGEDQCGGPTVRRELQFVTENVLSEDECKEAISLMKHSADEDTVKKKMKLTFVYRHNMVLDPLLSSNILSVFPRFKDIKGLIEQDFVLMFGEDVSGRLLERWPTTFKRKIIQQGRKLPSTTDLEELLLAADSPEDATEVNADIGWDSDLSAILLLLHLIPPSGQGRKRPGKVSASQAERHLVVFKKTGTNIQEHLDAITTSTQPYLLAVGVKKNDIHQFFIILDKNAIPCKSTSSLGAFDELFKAHFVFGTSYNTMLHNMYTFIQTTVYNIDVGKVKESPRVAEIRTRLLR